MARGTGTANLAASLEVLAGAPLDARTVVPTVEDLTLSSNFPYKYVGLPVVVQATGDLYILTGNDVTVAANWKKVGDGGSSGGSDNVVEGYYNTTDHLFYEDSSYTTLITGASEVIYVALDTNKTYRYDGLLFVRLDEESGGGGGGHTIVDESGTEMTQEDKLQFTSGLKVTDDNENLSTKVEADLMQAVDMSEIIPSLPGVMARSIYNNRFNRSDLYSTDEVLIGKWIDGKPIYQKTWTGLSISMSWNDKYLTTANFTITNHGFENIIKCLLHKTNKYVWQANAEISNANTINVQSVGADTFNSITLQYTKTTDGVSNVNFDMDYSTDETLIGKWINGKPLYQKTIDCGTLPNATTKNVAHGISNIDAIIGITGFSYGSSNNTYINLPHTSTGNNANSCIDVHADNTNIVIVSGTNRSAFNNSYVTLQYTKTTD